MTLKITITGPTYDTLHKETIWTADVLHVDTGLSASFLAKTEDAEEALTSLGGMLPKEVLRMFKKKA